MALDPATVTQLQTLQTELQTKRDALTASQTTIANIMTVIAAAGLTPAELIQVKDVLFSSLPNATQLAAQMTEIDDSLSAITKLLAVQ